MWNVLMVGFPKILPLCTSTHFHHIQCVISVALADIIGRKFAIIVGGVVFFIGGAVQAGSIALWYCV